MRINIQPPKYQIFFSYFFCNTELIQEQQEKIEVLHASEQKIVSQENEVKNEQIEISVPSTDKATETQQSEIKNQETGGLKTIIKSIILLVIGICLYYIIKFAINKIKKMLLERQRKKNEDLRKKIEAEQLPINKLFSLKENKDGLCICFDVKKGRPNTELSFYYDGTSFWQSNWMSKILYTIFSEFSKESGFRYYTGPVYVTKKFCEKLKVIFEYNLFFETKDNKLISNQDYFDALNQFTTISFSGDGSKQEFIKTLRSLFLYRKVYDQDDEIDEFLKKTLDSFSENNKNFISEVRKSIKTLVESDIKSYPEIAAENLFDEVHSNIPKETFTLEIFLQLIETLKNKKDLLKKIQTLPFLQMLKEIYPKLKPVSIKEDLVVKQPFVFPFVEKGGLSYHQNIVTLFFQALENYMHDFENINFFLRSQGTNFNWCEFSEKSLKKRLSEYLFRFFIIKEGDEYHVFQDFGETRMETSKEKDVLEIMKPGQKKISPLNLDDPKEIWSSGCCFEFKIKLTLRDNNFQIHNIIKKNNQ